MTTQFILTVLFLMVSHGMEGKSLEFLFEKYIITKHIDDHLLGVPVEIKMHPKPLNEIVRSSKLDLVPAVIVRNNKGMGEKVGYISEESFKSKTKVVMAFGNKNYKLDRMIQKDGKPQTLVWKHVWGEEVVFTRIECLDSNANLMEKDSLEEAKHKSFENVKTGSKIAQTKEFAEWQQKLVSCLSQNPKGMFLSKLGEICGKPREFEVQGGLKQAITLVSCVSILDIPSPSKNSKLCAHVAILQTGCPTNKPNESQKVKILKAQQDSNILNPQQHARNTKLQSKEPNILLCKEVTIEDMVEKKLFGDLFSALRHGAKIFREGSEQK